MDVVYFELSHWTPGLGYPNKEPFLRWMKDDLFQDEEWVKQNKLCVLRSMTDLTSDLCITASREWVEQNCPELLIKYHQFLRFPDSDGIVYGKFGDEFLEYTDWNIGITEFGIF